MVLASPVVPQTMTASVPFSSWKSRSRPRTGRSTVSFVKGVTMATPEPVKSGVRMVEPPILFDRLLALVSIVQDDFMQCNLKMCRKLCKICAYLRKQGRKNRMPCRHPVLW